MTEPTKPTLAAGRADDAQELLNTARTELSEALCWNAPTRSCRETVRSPRRRSRRTIGRIIEALDHIGRTEDVTRDVALAHDATEQNKSDVEWALAALNSARCHATAALAELQPADVLRELYNYSPAERRRHGEREIVNTLDAIGTAAAWLTEIHAPVSAEMRRKAAAARLREERRHGDR